MNALPSMPLWFKRTGPLFPINSSNEGDILVVDGKLICAVFNRPPKAQEVLFYDVSDLASPVLLAQKPWAAAMGSMLVDGNGVLHIYGASPPGRNDAPYNSLVHSTVDANWNIAAPNTIIGPSGMGFNNIAVAVIPGGYVMAIEQAYSNGNKAESYITSTVPDFSIFTVKSAFYNPGTPTTDFTGKSRIRHMPDGWNYVTSDTWKGDTRIARTQDFVTFEFASGPFSFLGPDFGDAFPGVVGGDIFYNGNVSWEEWTFSGDPCVVGVFFQGNEVTAGGLRVAMYPGDLASLFAKFF